MNSNEVTLTTTVFEWVTEQKALGNNSFLDDYESLPQTIKEYIDTLINEIQFQAIDTYISLFDPNEYYEYTEDYLIEQSNLPESVIDFYRVIGAPYEYIKDLVLLSVTPDIAAFILEDNMVNEGYPFTSFIVTASYTPIKEAIDEALPNIEDNKIFALNSAEDEDTYWKLFFSSMFDHCVVFANEIGHEYFQRYLENAEIH